MLLTRAVGYSEGKVDSERRNRTCSQILSRVGVLVLLSRLRRCKFSGLQRNATSWTDYMVSGRRNYDLFTVHQHDFPTSHSANLQTDLWLLVLYDHELF